MKVPAAVRERYYARLGADRCRPVRPGLINTHNAALEAALEQLREELVEEAYCVEEFLRKVTQWEGCAEDELTEAIESAEKLSAALDSLTKEGS